MKRKFLSITALVALALTAGLVLAGCSNSTSGGGGFVPVATIANVPRILLKDDVFELSDAVVIPSNATNRAISWSGDIAGGKFQKSDAATYTVTATIANGLAEGVPYTKEFPISVINGNDTADILSAQGSWTKDSTLVYQGILIGGTDTLTIAGYTWTVKNSNLPGILTYLGLPGGTGEYSKGIIIKAEGSRYKTQTNAVMGLGGTLYPSYSYHEGTYTFIDSNTVELESDNSAADSLATTGTWTK